VLGQDWHYRVVRLFLCCHGDSTVSHVHSQTHTRVHTNTHTWQAPLQPCIHRARNTIGIFICASRW
jgi:hypothetical protein